MIPSFFVTALFRVDLFAVAHFGSGILVFCSDTQKVMLSVAQGIVFVKISSVTCTGK